MQAETGLWKAREPYRTTRAGLRSQQEKTLFVMGLQCMDNHSIDYMALHKLNHGIDWEGTPQLPAAALVPTCSNARAHHTSRSGDAFPMIRIQEQQQHASISPTPTKSAPSSLLPPVLMKFGSCLRPCPYEGVSMCWQVDGKLVFACIAMVGDLSEDENEKTKRIGGKTRVVCERHQTVLLLLNQTVPTFSSSRSRYSIERIRQEGKKMLIRSYARQDRVVLLIGMGTAVGTGGQQLDLNLTARQVI